MTQKLTIEAKSVAAFATLLADMPHETRATVTATENGTPWATVSIAPTTDTRRTAFPNILGTTAVGDSRKRGQSGARFTAGEARDALRVVIYRAAKMV
ncbi:hypothetical protein [Microbacterium sp. zg-YB36]|uniref:hypothetical protein n=1 Tax=Microbacterium sp. zg-YB36 TaxID=2969407 RepID=UPI00214B8825|nr:hypothetical protein [Microbacterium sp. zg-YB36]MDL5351162.1 hypothetical protein [Microbacterium sp. zg-YB36]